MSASAGRRDPFVGLVLDGKYEVVSLLARGGMGRVYRAVQRPLNREVAVKILDLDQLDARAKGADFARRFFLEAAACAKLNHPNTVVVYDYGQAAEDVFYIAMELLEGHTLDQALEHQAPLEPARVKHVGLQICGSIGEAHERGMIHRDLKPSNVMLCVRGADPDFVKVLDFGLVKQADDAGLTQSGALLGTPRYIAPEQIGSSDVGPESDVYSLGACLYHCLTGRPPFDSDSKFVLLASHMNVEPTPIHDVVPDSPASPELAAVVMRCLRKDPTMRFRSMAELVEALLATPEPSLSARSSLPTSSSPGLSSPGLSRPGASSAGVSKPPSALERSGVQRSSADVLATSVERPGSLVLPPTTPVPTHASLAIDPKRAVPITLVAVVLGAAVVVGGYLALRPAAPTAPPAAAVQPEPTPTPAPEPVVVEVPVPAAVAAPVRLVVEPAGARVQRDGADLGDAPLSLPVPRGESWVVRIQADGYEPREISVLGGQGEVSVSLERTSRGRPGRPSRPSTTSTAPVEEPAPTPMVDPEPTPMSTMTTPRTDNRDPWAR
ncbi:MAG: serine/threonine protein kinase [Sandaracinus sp.]|nr:serine/threonine protein kinase [Sandaracinus sp.]MCB9619490.1 serine/threonine protein kinase [Sandaracinus sp.]